MKTIITDCEYPNCNPEKAIFDAAGIDLEVYQYREEEDLLTIVKDADALITQYSNVSRRVLESAKNCKIVVKYGIGVDNIDLQAATDNGIYVCNIPDYGVDEVSNHSITHMLNLARKLHISNADMKKGIWDYKRIVPIKRFSDSTVGILGFGRMGHAVAYKLRNFGVKLLACDIRKDMEIAKYFNVSYTDFDTLFRESDYIAVHCEYNETTHKLVGERAFNLMKPTAFIINTARGPIIDEQALIKALLDKRIAGAGLDVFEQEPIDPNNPLLKFDNVILSGHTSWYSEESQLNLQTMPAELIVSVLKGNPPYNVRNPKVLGKL